MEWKSVNNPPENRTKKYLTHQCLAGSEPEIYYLSWQLIAVSGATEYADLFLPNDRPKKNNSGSGEYIDH